MSHTKKYKEFIKACKQNDADVMVVESLWVLGDNIGEIDLNIKMAINHGKIIHIAESGVIISKGTPLS